MTRLPYGQRQAFPQDGVAPAPSPLRRYRFRWKLWLLVPLTCLGIAWFLNGVESPTFEWTEIMEWLKAQDQERYTRLAVLAICLVAVVGILRVLGGTKK